MSAEVFAGLHICSFEAVDLPRGKALTYEALKVAVLKAGRFSVFEATETHRRAQLFTQLGRDLEVEFLHDAHGFSYPWTGVRRRELKPEQSTRLPLTPRERVEAHGQIPVVAPIRRRVPDYPGDSEFDVIHLAWGMNSRGSASSLCRPTRKVSQSDSWCLRWQDVTCLRCRAVGQKIIAGDTP